MGKSISKEQMLEYKDISKGRFDEKEITHMHTVFHKASPSGKMKPADFKRYLEGLEMFKRVDPHETYDHLFRGYDRDGNGEIDFKEYLLFHSAILYSTEELLDLVFRTYDRNRNGFIYRDDLVTVLTNSTRWMGDCDVETKEVQELIRSEVDMILEFVDSNHKGFITKDTLRLVSNKHPEILEKLKNLAWKKKATCVNGKELVKYCFRNNRFHY